MLSKQLAEYHHYTMQQHISVQVFDVTLASKKIAAFGKGEVLRKKAACEVRRLSISYFSQIIFYSTFG